MATALRKHFSHSYPIINNLVTKLPSLSYAFLNILPSIYTYFIRILERIIYKSCHLFCIISLLSGLETVFIKERWAKSDKSVHETKFKMK